MTAQADMDYLGHPYYVSGNAIYHALGTQLEHDVHQHINGRQGFRSVQVGQTE